MDAEEARMQKLEPIIARIPEAWGKWVSCGPGWDALLLELDASLAEVDPAYELHQVKEKFGGLRYYAETQVSDAEARLTFDRLIREGEERAERTCEECGAEDATVSTKAVRSWVRTLCETCRAAAEARSRG